MGRVKEMFPLGLRKTVKARRAQCAGSLGWERYSWPALNDLDRRMASLLPAHGTFLEIGANDGYSQSNTYYLERHRGWRGVLVEPLPGLAERARRLRTASICFNLACVAPEQVGKPLALVDDDLMTSVSAPRGGRAGEVHVGTSTLSAVIDAAGLGPVTFMSIDVEGAERDVLAGLDLARHTPGFLLVETKDPDAVEHVLRGRMALTDTLSHHDYLFRSLPQSPELGGST